MYFIWLWYYEWSIYLILYVLLNCCNSLAGIDSADTLCNIPLLLILPYGTMYLHWVHTGQWLFLLLHQILLAPQSGCFLYYWQTGRLQPMYRHSRKACNQRVNNTVNADTFFLHSHNGWNTHNTKNQVDPKRNLR